MSTRSSLLAQTGRALDGLRRFILNLVFFGILAALVVSAVMGRPRVPRAAALVLKPEGTLVEQLSSDPGRFVSEPAGAPPAAKETLVKDVLDALRLAKDDGRIKALYLDLDDLEAGGMSKLRDVRAALLDFKKSGKKVIAYADGYSQVPYYIAAHADEVFLNPEGLLLLEGFGRHRAFYKEGLDRFGIEMHVFRVGEYKSAVEPFLRNDMSPEAKEALRDVYGDLWHTWLRDVAEARKLQPEAIQEGIDALPDRLRAASGDMARMALDAKLVDTLAARDQVRKRMIELVGEDKEKKTFKQIPFARYLAARAGDRERKGRGDAVAVVVAKGEILGGDQPPGHIGGDSTAALVRKARQDEKTKAIVLRIDSPGGSAFASEVIRRECEVAREGGKQVVISMGSLAASGGYWISTASDEIWASPSTITGAIGIFGLFPSIHKPLARYLGVHMDGVGTTRFSDAFNPGRPLDPALADAIQQVINNGYEDFLARVGKARNKTREEVDRIARGRIWSGEDAKGLGLVDQLGNLDDAIASAAKRAKLGKDYRVWYVEKELTLKERILKTLTTGFARVARAVGWSGGEEPAPTPPPVAKALRSIGDEMGRVSLWNDPRGLYAHCLCGEEWP